MAKRSTVNVTLGQRIRAERLAWDLTQDQLCDEAKLSKSFLSDLENDKRRPSADSLLALAGALGTTMEYLVCGET